MMLRAWLKCIDFGVDRAHWRIAVVDYHPGETWVRYLAKVVTVDDHPELRQGLEAVVAKSYDADVGDMMLVHQRHLNPGVGRIRLGEVGQEMLRDDTGHLEVERHSRTEAEMDVECDWDSGSRKVGEGLAVVRESPLVLNPVWRWLAPSTVGLASTEASAPVV